MGMVGPGLSRMLLKTGSRERMLSINCLGENSQGVVSHTMYVHTHYLPESIEVTGPSSVTEGEEAHLSCVTSGAYPSPVLRFRISKSEKEEEDYIAGDVRSETLPDGGLVTSMEMNMLVDEDSEQVSVECLAVVDGIGEKNSNTHTIKHIRKSVTILKENDNKDAHEISEVDSANPMLKEDENESKETDSPLKHTLSIDNTVDNPHQHEKSQNRDVIGSSVENDLELDGIADTQGENEQLSIAAAPLSELEEKKKTKKVLWIPYKPVEDIQDYQSVFEPDSERSDDTYEEFLRPSDIPEAPMLKQEKMAKPTFVNNPLSA